MSWLCATQVLSESPDSTNDSPSDHNNGEIVGILRVDTNNGETTDYKIRIGENYVGRDPEICSIVLENKTLSKVHALIECGGTNSFFITDLGSTNKTQHKEMKLIPNKAYQLYDGDKIIFGNAKAKFIILREDSNSSQSSLSPVRASSQSLLSPVRNSQESSNNQRNSISESPVINDSIFDAPTQNNLEEPSSSNHVFKVPQSLKPKSSKISIKLKDKVENDKVDDDDDDDDIYSLSTQASVPGNESANLNYSDVFDQPTQCQIETDKKKSSGKMKIENLDNSDVFDMQTQCPINKSSDESIFDQPTQMQIKQDDDDDDDFIFEEATQCPVKAKEAVNDKIFEEETQIPLNATNESIFDAETQVPIKKKKKSSSDDDDEIFNAATQKVKFSNDVFDTETQAKKKESLLDDEVFEEETQITFNGFSRNESIFEADTQAPKFSDSSTIFDAETQQPEKSLSRLSLGLDDSESSIFGAETQCPEKKESSNDSNEILAALPDSVFDEPTQIPVKTPQSERKRKRPVKHDNAALFKGKRKSAEDAKNLLNDGHDDLICEYMNKNSPALKKENEEDEFGDDLNLDDIPNEVFDPDTQTPGYKKSRSHLDSGIADERDDEDLTQTLSLNETENDSGVKDKEDSIASKGKGSVNMVLSSSSDEDCDIATTPIRGSKSSQIFNFKVPDNRILEDSVPTQVLTSNNIVNQQISSASQVRCELEDEIPTQILNTKKDEDFIPTQPFNINNKTDEDLIPTQIFNNKVVESSDDETDSDVDIPQNKAIENSDTESDVESININEIERIETPKSVGSDTISNPDDKSNDSFSLMKDIEEDSTNSLPNCKSPNLLGETDAICNLSPNDEFLNAREGKNVGVLNKNNRRLSPTQILFVDEEKTEIREERTNISEIRKGISPTQVMFDDKDDLEVKNEVLRKSGCSPTQVLSDSDTDCEMEIKKEQQYEETQVLPLSPPQNYKPRVLTKDDAWMLGDDMKDSIKWTETDKGKIKDNDSDDDWGPLSLELPSTQVFQQAVEDKANRMSPEKPIHSSKRPRDSQEDTIKPQSKYLKNGNSPTFKAPRNLFDTFNSEVTNGPKQNESRQMEIISESRPKRLRTPTWKVKLEKASDEENSPEFRWHNKNNNKLSIVDDDKQNLDDTDSPIIKLPKRGLKTKPLVIEDSQDQEEVKPVRPRRRSARLQKSSSASSRTSNSSEESSKFSVIEKIVPRRRNYFPNQIVKVLFTSYNDCEDEAKIIEQLGGEVVKNVTDATVVITKRVKRTVKFLSAVSLGIPIVTPDWVEHCEESGLFINPWPYVVKDNEQEQKFGFQLEKAIKKAKKKKLFQGYKVYATPNAKPPPNELYVLVEVAGGEPLRNPPDVWPDKTIVISCPEDQSFWPPPKLRRGTRVELVHFEFLLTGLLQQRLNFKTHSLR